MDVTVAESGSCRRTLHIVIPPERIKEHINEVFKQAAGQVSVKGFRPGKVPRKVLEQKFGDEILSEAKQKLINDSFDEAVREQKLTPLGRPEIEGIDDKPLDDSASLEFDVHFDVRPEFELGNAKGLQIARGDGEVNDADVDNALQQLAESKRTMREVDEPVGDGDFVKADMKFVDAAGNTVSERQGAQLNTNIPIAGTDPETFAAKLRGAEKGQQIEIELTFPDTFDKEEVRGQQGAVHLTLHDVLRVVPAAIDDELAKGYDFESLDALKADLRTRLADEKARANTARQEQDLLNILIHEHQFELPASMVQDQKRHSLREFEERMKRAELPEEEIAQKLEQADGEAEQDAERRVRTFFLLEAAAKKHKIFVTEGDVEVELRTLAAQNNVSVGDVRDYYEKHRLLADLRLGLMERKVRDFLRENADLTD